MKRKITFSVVLILLFNLTACSGLTDWLDEKAPKDPVLQSLGTPSTENFYSSGGIQDFTDYAIYTYEEVNLTDNTYFQAVTEENQEELLSYIGNYGNWVDVHRVSSPKSDLVLNYSFDETWITEDWCFCIQDKVSEGGIYDKYDNYNLYILDVPNKTLYYFHTNI